MAGRFFALLLAVSLCLGCGGYPEISPAAYQYAKALYSVANRQRSEKLDAVSHQISESQRDGKITEREAEWLRRIIDDARQGEWQTAQQVARQMMDDQVR